ncbi:TIR domain-containing protein [Sphingobium yanoikuyae]|uniref:TIR domain-containing protein n=1 Tax=Sphingobium yanoikuyae TaxID=13690 RepID=A0AA42X2V0_SPHYA|nr:TIR domain-containing protein [Sphingobium yanoikuyae]MDH2135071.1 TIR domain-containing protein [Sphingobium yanoikuyae]MDH2153108.1 TIR domain-containing protein [Sphingobium yanoikuyae]MDH2170376.1 TIR domain-containing protein [Sphingobium yanoikuyae]HEV7436653.1 TIR domain-containing protein [Pseudorhizobium sp.]
MSVEQEREVGHKAFISYAWSSPEHKAWVRRLAERLVEDGVFIILDEWDLKPGHDPLHFMEQSITSPEVTKVLIICDQMYKEKANGRAGGVGTETQILTPEIYRKVDQNKYAALVTEADDEGKAYVPTFYGGRIFIDFSDAAREEEAYEELMRWINDAPLHVRPKLGKKPAYLDKDAATPLVTQSRYRRAKEGVERNSPGAAGLLREFGEGLVEQLVALRPDRSRQDGSAPIDEIIVSAADAMRPYVRQMHDLTRSIARGASSAFDDLLAILEQLLATTERDREATSWNPAMFDANRMVAYEGFLGVIATLLAERRIDLIAQALDHPYFYEDPSGGRGRSTKDFEEFGQYAESLQGRNQRLGQNRADWQAEFIHEHYKVGSPAFSRMMEADLLLYLIRPIRQPGGYATWYPRTLVYSSNWYHAFELFARMESARYFSRVSEMLFGSVSAEEFKERTRELGTQRLWRHTVRGPAIGTLAGIEHIASRN